MNGDVSPTANGGVSIVMLVFGGVELFPRHQPNLRRRFFWCVGWGSIVYIHTVDGKNPANQLRLVVYYPIIYKVLYIPAG